MLRFLTYIHPGLNLLSLWQQLIFLILKLWIDHILLYYLRLINYVIGKVLSMDHWLNYDKPERKSFILIRKAWPPILIDSNRIPHRFIMDIPTGVWEMGGTVC